MLLNCGVGEDSQRVPWTAEIKPVNPNENQPWIFSERTDAEPEAPVIWPSDGKSQLTGKDPDAGKDWEQEEKEEAENEMVGWCHRLNGHEFEQTLGDSEGQGSMDSEVHGSQKVGHDLATEPQLEWLFWIGHHSCNKNNKKQVRLHQTRKLLHSKRNNQQIKRQSTAWE